MADSWNSVQIVTLVVEAATPVTVAVLGVFFARASRRIEQVQWANQTVVTHRLDVFSQLAPGLNQLLCFATFVGGLFCYVPAIQWMRVANPAMYASWLFLAVCCALFLVMSLWLARKLFDHVDLFRGPSGLTVRLSARLR